MTEMKMRRKRVAEDDEEDEFYHSPPNKRGRAGSAAFKWLWAPSPHPDEPRPQGLWPDTERLFRTQSGHRDFNLPRSFSLPPETSSRRTSRRRGAISVTSSPPPSELDRHLAMQLQQQIAIIRLKAASRGADDDEVERMRRELEDVQIDAALPSILGISLDFDRKLDLGSSRSPQGSEQRGKVTNTHPPNHPNDDNESRLTLTLFSHFLSSSLAMCLSQQLRVGSRGTTTNMTGPMNLPKPLLPGRRSNMRDPI
ncbi:hypothetical protein CGLO_01505 [Colletotrichum gloeosporioides Cg-14]|uniref:Uncharacterized protein n=1 Tax=Colletotrichum gloeosporioides (strain Cg-14) TaxID=1237896 RepID=T0M3W8_COLGC|nr:hypothetical protein CGLO_01505 [Colletotrichum gloeosporioides Cg-14]